LVSTSMALLVSPESFSTLTSLAHNRVSNRTAGSVGPNLDVGVYGSNPSLSNNTNKIGVAQGGN